MRVMTLLLAAIPGHVLDPAKRPLFLLLIGFILTFSVARLNSRLASNAFRLATRNWFAIFAAQAVHRRGNSFGITAPAIECNWEAAGLPTGSSRHGEGLSSWWKTRHVSAYREYRW